MQYVNALSPPIAGERVGVEGWGGNGHLLEAYSTEPTWKPQSTMCSFWDLRRYAVVAVAVGRGKLKNVRLDNNNNKRLLETKLTFATFYNEIPNNKLHK